MPDEKHELPSLEVLQKRIEQATPKSDEEPEEPNGARLGKAMQLATELVAGGIVGGGLGYLADRLFGTSPWLFIVFFFLGFAAGVKNMLRSAKQL